jgi:hypothetical protein
MSTGSSGIPGVSAVSLSREDQSRAAFIWRKPVHGSGAL